MEQNCEKEPLQKRKNIDSSIHTKEKDCQTEKKKNRRKQLQELTLLDRFLFDEAMRDSETAENMLSIITGNEIGKVRYGIEEKNLEPYYDSRAVRLDMLVFDEKDFAYDAEAQRKNYGHRVLSRRSRFYQAHLDVNLLPKGEIDFGKLTDAYTIFIAPFDIFGKGRYRYTFHMRCEEDPEICLEDGATRLFLNTKGNNKEGVTEELIELLKYMEKGVLKNDPIESEKVQKIADRVEAVKADQEVGVKYMRLWEELTLERMEARKEGREEGIKEGIKEGKETERIVLIENLMKNTGMRMEEAMENLGISPADRKRYAEMLFLSSEKVSVP